MKIFFFMGRNPLTRSGVSWKIWKIVRLNRSVTTYWGAAALERRKVVPKGDLAHRTRYFKSVAAAVGFEEKLIASKLEKGYERRTRWR